MVAPPAGKFSFSDAGGLARNGHPVLKQL